jgi:hypothetical protein
MFPVVKAARLRLSQSQAHTHNRRMAFARLINRAGWLCGVTLLAWEGFAAQPAVVPDPRNFANGWKVPVESYCDQPRIVVTKDGT